MTIKKYLPFAIATLLAAGLSYALGGESKLISGTPLLWIITVYCFLVQIIAFIPAAIFNTEVFYDLTGGLTYLSTVTLVLYFNHDNLTTKQIIAASIIVVWALRLASFLFIRILEKGSDSRFDPMKKNLRRFFLAWYLQGLWTVVTPCPLYVILTKSSNFTSNQTLNALEVTGLLIWFFGFIFEWTADYQKSLFNSKKQNKGRFISVGLWSISRHPNYFGEIVLWIGASVFAFPSLHNWEYVSLISPIFVYLLLSKLSGVPLLEKQASQRWGQEKAFQDYKNSTPVLFPFVSPQNKQSKDK